MVDDAVFMREELRAMLEKNGFEVIGEAGNGLEAIESYTNLKPDIVTMDITMPEMSGVDAVREIKKNNPNANIVMISAMGQEYLVKEAILNGANGFIIKPFKEEHLIKTLGKMYNLL
ncbi:response regulator [Clostridium saccharobutylicum]|uniref:response regulator n=1 Tax=Clostridium saccharobutylicum TaxID=169679 RepID=UPI0030FEDF4E